MSGSDHNDSDHNDSEYTDSYEDVSKFTLSGDREQALLDKQTECTFMWTTSTGDPVGVVMNFVHADGAFWLTCTRRRKRVPAVEARPRVADYLNSDRRIRFNEDGIFRRYPELES